MKKNLFFGIISCFILLFFSSCKAQQLRVVSFQSATRGLQKTITVEHQKVSIIYNNRGQMLDTTFNITKKEWNQLDKIVRGINLQQMKQLPTPSKKHQYDGAMASSISITNSRGRFDSATFDDFDAPTPLMPLMRRLMAFEAKVIKE